MINPFSLEKKRILVAGATSDISLNIINQLINLGAELIVVDNQSAIDEKMQTNEKILNHYVFDFYNIQEIESNLQKITGDFAPFHGFVYSAGIGGVRPLSLTKEKFLHEMMNANLYSFVEMIRLLSKKNVLQVGSSIVAISSVSSLKGLKSKTAYCASKAALDASIRCMALELADKNIRINSILKGWVKSDMNLDFIKNNMSLNENEDFKKQVLGVIEPIEIANTVAFLLSDATKTITGTSLLIDGGYTL